MASMPNKAKTGHIFVQFGPVRGHPSNRQNLLYLIRPGDLRAITRSVIGVCQRAKWLPFAGQPPEGVIAVSQRRAIAGADNMGVFAPGTVIPASSAGDYRQMVHFRIDTAFRPVIPPSPQFPISVNPTFDN